MYTPEIKELTEIILTHKRDLIYNVDTTRSILLLNPDISGSEVREAILKFVHTIVTYQTDINDLNDKLCTHINLLYVYRTLESELEALILWL